MGEDDDWLFANTLGGLYLKDDMFGISAFV